MPTVTYLPQGSANTGPDYVTRYTRTARVDFATAEASGLIRARNASGFWIGQTYAEDGVFDLFSFCNSIETRFEESDCKRAFLVTAQYGPWEPCNEDPTLNPTEVEIDFVAYERIVDSDVVNGNAILNSAGDPFDPPVTSDDSRLVLTFTRNELFYDIELADLVRDTINESAWRGFDTGTVKASAPRASRQYHPRIGWFWRVTYVFHLNRDGWDKVVLDAGMRKKVTGGQAVILTKDGAPVASPVPLNGSGNQLADGADPVWLTFATYRAIDFSIFNLDDA